MALGGQGGMVPIVKPSPPVVTRQVERERETDGFNVLGWWHS